MIKIKLMNYDATEAKLMEKDLQALASRGYTCKNIDYITFFKKDNRKVVYTTDIFHSNASTQFSKRNEKDVWLGKFYDRDYELLGNIKSIYVFQKKGSNIISKDIHWDPHFKKKHLLKKVILLTLSLILSYLFVPNVYKNTTINEYVTNGSIILHYIPLPIFITVVSRAIYNLYRTLQIPSKVIKNERRNRNIYIYSLLISISLLFIGIGLDSFNQKKVTVDKNNILTLSTLDFPSTEKKDTSYTQKSSWIIPYSYSYIEQSEVTDTKPDGNLLSVRYYECKDSAILNSFASDILTSPVLISAKEITEIPHHKDHYLATSKVTGIVDTMVIVKDKTLIIIATNFDLNNLDLQNKIIEFYKK